MQLTLEIPGQYRQGRKQSQIAPQIKLYAALLMFQSGQLSRGAAGKLTGVDVYDFFQACKQHHIEADVLRFRRSTVDYAGMPIRPRRDPAPQE